MKADTDISLLLRDKKQLCLFHFSCDTRISSLYTHPLIRSSRGVAQPIRSPINGMEVLSSGEWSAITPSSTPLTSIMFL